MSDFLSDEFDAGGGSFGDSNGTITGASPAYRGVPYTAGNPSLTPQQIVDQGYVTLSADGTVSGDVSNLRAYSQAQKNSGSTAAFNPPPPSDLQTFANEGGDLSKPNGGNFGLAASATAQAIGESLPKLPKIPNLLPDNFGVYFWVIAGLLGLVIFHQIARDI